MLHHRQVRALLAPIPWAERVWALPFLTCLAPSERYYEGKARKHKPVLDWGRQTPPGQV
jgi:hypothetical protein